MYFFVHLLYFMHDKLLSFLPLAFPYLLPLPYTTSLALLFCSSQSLKGALSFVKGLYMYKQFRVHEAKSVQLNIFACMYTALYVKLLASAVWEL